ncbi:MAG: molybdenum cofactor biosynthesis protein B [Acidiferrobacteraceae bacterium]|nr:molybdenum cofactor biosynthesis protein B [Acidiferrobacteraceae bacterium]|tara:strand:- start:2501 stop:3028 length:528 start_codon:yes stop_codon:yes gene_type:complete
MSDQRRDFIPVHIAVLTVSDSRTADNDKSGDLLANRLISAGHTLADRCIVKDDVTQIRNTASTWIANENIQVVIMTGGTGVTGFDGTPEAVEPLLGKKLDGFGEIFRSLSYEEIGTSALNSRALAGVTNGTYIFCLPGSSGACATAWDKILQFQLDYRTKPCNLVELMPRLLEAR